MENISKKPKTQELKVEGDSLSETEIVDPNF